MSTETMPESAPLAKPAPLAKSERSIEYVPFGANDKIKLTVAIVRNIVAVPTRDGDLPSERDCMKFLMLCQAGRLNPFAGDAFLIGYRSRDGVVNWSLITAISAFRKRAETHHEYNGEESGVIVMADGKVIDRVGDFTYPGDQLVGGWAKVYFKNRDHPMERRVKLDTFKKGFGQWLSDPAGMISKVAEAHALRDAFPTMMGGMYIGEEMGDENKPVKNGNGNGDAKTDMLNAAFSAPAAPPPQAHPTDENLTVDPTDASEPSPAPEDFVGEEVPKPAKFTVWPDFERAMRALVERDESVTSKMLTAAMDAIKLKGAGKAQWAKYYAAAQAGAFDWATGEIVG